MTISARTGPITAVRTTAEPDANAPAVPADHPGRWVGGLIGALSSLAAALVVNVVVDAPAILEWDSWSAIGLLGIPIGFILGRELLPMARGAGWGRALATGMLLGWVAPPLGAVEILGGSRLLELGNLSNSIGGPVALVLLPIAIPVSFIAIFITIPVGIAWAILLRLVPDDTLVALRVARPLERFGVRHALVVITGALLLLELAVRS